MVSSPKWIGMAPFKEPEGARPQKIPQRMWPFLRVMRPSLTLRRPALHPPIFCAQSIAQSLLTSINTYHLRILRAWQFFKILRLKLGFLPKYLLRNCWWEIFPKSMNFPLKKAHLGLTIFYKCTSKSYSMFHGKIKNNFQIPVTIGVCTNVDLTFFQLSNIFIILLEIYYAKFNNSRIAILSEHKFFTNVVYQCAFGTF
jgi:hypothetical protein